MATAAAVLVAAAGAAAACVVAWRDRRRTRRAADELADRTRRDPLTGLPTSEAVGAIVAELGSGADGGVSVLALELEGFGALNQAFGHEAGDALIATVAGQLATVVRPDERLVRLRGPAFAVVAPLRSAESVERRARELQAATQVGYEIGHQQVRVRVAVGAVSGVTARPGPVDAGDPAGFGEPSGIGPDCLAQARVALRQAQVPGHLGRVVVAADGPRAPVVRGAGLDARVRGALERGELVVHSMPLVEVATGRITGVEALLRWHDPDGGVTGPSAFLPVLEDSGLIVPVGRFVFEQACLANRRWQEAFPDLDLTTTVNLSPRQLVEPDVAEQLLAVLERTGVTPDRVCLEITESTLVRDIDASWSALRRLKETGVRLAVDDFGVGYSSLSYLRRFQLDVLKIDRSFVVGMADDRADADLVAQIVSLAHGLGIVPVAEGVDRAEHVDILRTMGCDVAQGYWYSRPVPPDEIDAVLARRVLGGPPAAAPEGGGQERAADSPGDR